MANSFDTDIDVTKVDLTNNLDNTRTGIIADNNAFDLASNDATAIEKDYGYTVRKILTNDLANRIFKYTSSEDLVANLNDVRDFIVEHQESQVPRLQVLNKYYMGHNISIYEAERRRLTTDKSDIRIANSYAKLIVETQVSYITDKPIETQLINENPAFKQFLDDINIQNDIDTHNKDLLIDMSVYGRAYEHIYRTEDGDRIGLSDVFNTFIIYDLTIEKKPIAAVRYILFNVTNENNETVKHVSVELYTNESIYTFDSVPFNYDLELTIKKNKDKTPNPILNSYGKVPIIEYRNSNRGLGDFEDVIDLIDVYDSVNSDTANYSNDTPDAMYQITGRMADSSMNSGQLKSLKNANMSYLKTGLDADGKEYSLKGEYVNPTYDVNGIEAFKNRIVSEIHKQSNTPDLSDEHFGGNQSGVAMIFKFSGMDQSASLKMSSFKTSAKKRYEIIKRIKNNVDSVNLDFNMNEINFHFVKNIPLNKAEMLKSAVDAKIKLSNETLIEYLPFINTEIELKRLEEQYAKEQEITNATVTEEHTH